MSVENKSVLVRILVATIFQGASYAPDQLVEFTSDDAQELKAFGYADDEQAAIDYCVNELKIEKIIHKTAVVEPILDEPILDVPVASEPPVTDALLVEDSQPVEDASPAVDGVPVVNSSAKAAK